MASLGDTDDGIKIKSYAHSIGFDLIGIAPVRALPEHHDKLKNWISGGMNAGMNFIAVDIQKRTDPSLLVEGVKSVIVTGINYFPSEKQGGEGIPVISKYAYGKDYHNVVGDKLMDLLSFINSIRPGARGKVCVDSSPILEKAWAKEAGLGWIGKNSILINKKFGSFIFLGEILLDIELGYDKPFSGDLCGSCSLCIKACPTGAINRNKTIDANKCISWLTVENKNDIPIIFNSRMNGRIFGCDICQDICPYNKDIIPHNNPDLRLSDSLRSLSIADYNTLSFEYFNKIFENSPIKRLTYKRFMRNINSVLSDSTLKD
jgi:epoxyqueuosine reductase